jgi:ABC-type bacteriocin/lantibiotic exporter with double-glycine peptidase domain
MLIENFKKEKNSHEKNINTIQLSDINFSFEGKKNLYSENINLEIKKGDHIGITGTSGSGKTTLVNMILGLIRPNLGQILYNNNDISISNISEYYELISYVPQDTMLFNDTIKNNLTFNDENIDFDRLNKVIKLCKLENFIENLPKKIETSVGEKGLKISGGQKQRIGIARALYRSFDLLILDEATSSLNKDYEDDILGEISSLFTDKIIITISHDSNVLKYCNKKINIKNNEKN